MKKVFFHDYNPLNVFYSQRKLLMAPESFLPAHHFGVTHKDLEHLDTAI